MRAAVALALLAVGLVPAAAHAQNDLDTSWGTNGKFAAPVGPGSAYINAAARQPDGKVVLAGYAEQSATDPTNLDFLVARLTADGKLDTTFNAGGALPGVRTTPIAPDTANDAAYGVAIGPGGTIYAVGDTDPAPPFGPNFGDYAIVRYTSAGVEDTSFSGDGIHTISTGQFDSGRGVVVQDGKPVLVGTGDNATGRGMQVLRLDPATGALDATFNPAGPTPGISDIDFGNSFGDQGKAIALQSDNKFVVAGSQTPSGGNTDIGLARLNSDGTPDATFGGGTGRVQTPLPENVTVDEVALPGGKIVIAGDRLNLNNGQRDFLLARYTAEGVADSSFSEDGIQTTDFTATDGTRAASATGLVFEDGKILASGWAFNCPGIGCADFAVARYLDNGSLDPTFGTGGKRTYAIGTANDFASAAVPGSVIAAGGCDDAMQRAFICAAVVETAAAAVVCPNQQRPVAGQVAQDDGAPDDSDDACYDLRVRLPGPTELRYPQDFGDAPLTKSKWGYRYEFVVENLGPLKSPATNALFDASLTYLETYIRERRGDTGSTIVEVVRLDGKPHRCTRAKGGRYPSLTNFGIAQWRLSCPVEALAKGESITFEAFLNPETLGDVLSFVKLKHFVHVPVEEDACKAPPEKTCINNRADNVATIVESKTPTTVVKKGTSKILEGTAVPNIKNAERVARAAAELGTSPLNAPITRQFVGVKRVAVAIRRTGAGSPRTGCSWRKSKRKAKFVNRPCKRPIWIGAKGTNRWTLRLRRPLPPGCYIAYARATDGAGVSNPFKARAKGRLRFRVGQARC